LPFSSPCPADQAWHRPCLAAPDASGPAAWSLDLPAVEPLVADAASGRWIRVAASPWAWPTCPSGVWGDADVTVRSADVGQAGGRGGHAADRQQGQSGHGDRLDPQELAEHSCPPGSGGDGGMDRSRGTPREAAGEPRRQTKRSWSRSRYTPGSGVAVTLAAAGAVLPEKLVATLRPDDRCRADPPQPVPATADTSRPCQGVMPPPVPPALLRHDLRRLRHGRVLPASGNPRRCPGR
jgi:hypothetical protein